MAVKEILLLGNDKLYQVSAPIEPKELMFIKSVTSDMHDTIIDFRKRYGFGRAIAAPQIDIPKRLVYMYIEKPIVFINPTLTFPDKEMIEIWDNCMSFPDLMVKVRRYRRCHLEYRNLDWEPVIDNFEGDMSELLQHECDHLDGILAVQRAIDNKSFMLRSEYLKL
jgi:peptide deformylase